MLRTADRLENADSQVRPRWSGIFGHDGWAVYDKFSLATHQQCFAHLLRRCDSLIESGTGGALADDELGVLLYGRWEQTAHITDLQKGLSSYFNYYNSSSDCAFVLEVGKHEVLLFRVWSRGPSATVPACLMADDTGLVGIEVAAVQNPGPIRQRMAA